MNPGSHRLSDDEVRYLVRMAQHADLNGSRREVCALAAEVLDLRAKLAAAEELLRPREIQ